MKRIAKQKERQTTGHRAAHSRSRGLAALIGGFLPFFFPCKTTWKPHVPNRRDPAPAEAETLQQRAERKKGLEAIPVCEKAVVSPYFNLQAPEHTFED